MFFSCLCFLLGMLLLHQKTWVECWGYTLFLLSSHCVFIYNIIIIIYWWASERTLWTVLSLTNWLQREIMREGKRKQRAKLIHIIAMVKINPIKIGLSYINRKLLSFVLLSILCQLRFNIRRCAFIHPCGEGGGGGQWRLESLAFNIGIRLSVKWNNSEWKLYENYGYYIPLCTHCSTHTL